MSIIDSTNGFPSGYFIIKNDASGRVLDVQGDGIEDGTEVLLWTETETSLVEALRNPTTNNQVWYVDTSGALCSRSSGHAIDVEEGRLVLRHRRPVSHPYPNKYSHPLPRFCYSRQTGEITVMFESDPSYPPPSDWQSEAWKSKHYLLTSVPLRKPRTIIDDASEFISSTFALPLAGLSNMITGITNNVESSKSEENPSRSLARPEEVFDGEIDLREHDVIEEERGEEGEVDDSPELGRKVAVIGIPVSEAEGKISRVARARRTWSAFPLRNANARTAHV